MTAAAVSPQANHPDAGQVYHKLIYRLVPVLFICYILAYLDRVNVGFAKLAMKEEPWFSDAVFATGSGIFFIGYFIFEVPGNLLLHRIGARVWITRIMISWGILSTLCALSSTPFTFYLFRFLLGIAEAGFFPGILLYLTYWFPKRYRVQLVALFMTAVTVAGVIGSPLSGWILDQMSASTHLKSWQWLFVIEGIPSILLGLFLPFLLTDRPEKASWLRTAEKKLIAAELHAEEQSKQAVAATATQALRSGKVWLFSMIYFGLVIGLYGVSFWLPQIISSTITQEKTSIGFYAAIPWLCATVGMIIYGRHSDRTGERHWHIIIAAFLAMCGFIASGMAGLPAAWILIFLCVATTGVMCGVTCFWSLPAAVLSGTAAAAGIALVNSVGNLAGYLSPELFAALKAKFSLGTALMGTGLAQGGSALLVGLLLFAASKKAR